MKKNTVGVRSGKWKLLAPGRRPKTTQGHYYLKDFGSNDYELYDLEKDPGERKNVVRKHPDVVRGLALLLKGAQ